MKILALDGLEIKVDDEDYPKIKPKKWRIVLGYVVSGYGKNKITMSHCVLDIPPQTGVRVRYRNGNRLDNQRHNLVYDGRNLPKRLQITEEQKFANEVEERLKQSRKMSRPTIKIKFERGVRRPDMHELAQDENAWREHLRKQLRSKK